MLLTHNLYIDFLHHKFLAVCMEFWKASDYIHVNTEMN